MMMARSKQKIIDEQFEEICRLRKYIKDIGLKLLNDKKISHRQYREILQERYGK